jgi:hypothetical protein
MQSSGSSARVRWERAPLISSISDGLLRLLGQEKRFLLFLFLKDQNEFLTHYEIAAAIRDQRSNVIRNLYAFIAEGLVIARRDEETRITSFRINGEVLERLSELFRPASRQCSP